MTRAVVPAFVIIASKSHRSNIMILKAVKQLLTNKEKKITINNEDHLKTNTYNT